MDRTTFISLSLALIFHAMLALVMGKWTMEQMSAAEVPLLIEVTLSGSSAPKSVTEGLKGAGEVIGKAEKSDEAPAMTEEQIQAWKAERRRQIMKELSRTRGEVGIGATEQELRNEQNDLAAGRGAGDWGDPGSPKGTLSLTGAIAARGYKEPDFSVLKKLITEETTLQVTVIVLPGGEVKKALLYKTSGFPFVDQKALELTRKIIFDPLPSDWKQVEQQGVLTIKLKL